MNIDVKRETTTKLTVLGESFKVFQSTDGVAILTKVRDAPQFLGIQPAQLDEVIALLQKYKEETAE